jgi:hypothetical protein
VCGPKFFAAFFVASSQAFSRLFSGAKIIPETVPESYLRRPVFSTKNADFALLRRPFPPAFF